MVSVSNRRSFFHAAAAVAVTGWAASRGVGSALAQAAAGISRAPLRNNLALLSGAGGNVVVMTGADGALLIDGGLAARSTELLAAVAEHTSGAAIHTLFNTHWHDEQTGSNETLGKAGTKIIAHENTRLWLGTTIVRPTEGWTHLPLPPAAQPTETFYTSGAVDVGEEQVEYRHLPQAHTDGDLYVFFPRSNVLVAGDLVSVGRYPVLDYVTGGFLPGLVQATQALLDVTDAETLIVPGAGPAQSRAHLQKQLDMLSEVLERMIAMLYRGLSAKDMIAEEVTKGFDAEWGDPDPFVSAAYKGMWGHVREFEGIV